MFTIDENSEYFSWGIPTDEKKEIFCLYASVLDRFIFITNSRENAIQLGILISSKINTIPIRIDTSKNYSSSLIDNSCCLRWTVEDNQNINTFSPYSQLTESDIIHFRGYLIESNLNYDISIIDNINTIRNYLFVAQWILLQNDCNQTLNFKYGKDILPCVFGSNLEQIKKLQKECFESLFLCTDIKTILPKIKNNVQKIKEISRYI